MADVHSSTVYMDGKFIPFAEATVSVMTHGLNYGTGCFEGIRGYWNEQNEQIYVFRMLEHYRRMHNSASILKIKLPHTPEELCDITLELIRRNGWREDTYIRPLAFKGSEIIGVRLHNLEDRFTIYLAPMGNYVDVDTGCRVGVSSWRRIDDNMIPARAKVTGAYVNSAFAKTEAQENGFDEAIVLDSNGHVSEGSAENLFLVENGKLITPPVSDNILVGITRDTVMTVAREELGIETVERTIDRTELYVADEVFMCGTGAQISPIIEVDHRPVGRGKMGPLTAKLQKLYFGLVRHTDPHMIERYGRWCSPAYTRQGTLTGKGA